MLTAGVALVALGFGIAATSGLWLGPGGPGGRMVEQNVPDAIHYSWWLGHTVHALAGGTTPFQTQDLNWPEGVSAMNNTTLLLPALVLAPVTALWNSLVTLNLLNVVAVPACAAAGYWALRRIPLGEGPLEGTVSRPAALVGAVTFAISPAIVNSLVGHVTMAFAPGLPVLVVLGVRTWTSSRPARTGLVLGLVTAAQVFTGEEVLFQAAVGIFLIMVVSAASRPRAVPAAARRLAIGVGAALAAFLPIAGYPLYLQFFGPLAQSGSPFLPDYYGADVTAFTTPTGQVLFHTRGAAEAALGFPGGLEEHLAYLGWPLLITAAVTAMTGRRLLAVRCATIGLLVAMALSLGGRVWTNGEWTEIPGPYALLQRLPVTEASLATRFGLLAAIFAGAVLAFAVHLTGQWNSGRLDGRLVAAGLAALCLAPLVPRPLPTAAAPAVPAWFTTAARHLPDHDVVVVLPYPAAANPVAMRWQSAAGYRFRMPGGYFLGPASDGQAYVGGSADPPTAALLDEVAKSGQAVSPTAEQRRRAERDLRAWGASKIVLGPDPAQAALRATVTALTGTQPVSAGGVDVWPVAQ
jgi:hypothetical protein